MNEDEGRPILLALSGKSCPDCGRELTYELVAYADFDEHTWICAKCGYKDVKIDVREV